MSQTLRNATVADGQGQGTIQNDDTPVLNINDVASAEGDSGTTTFHFYRDFDAAGAGRRDHV